MLSSIPYVSIALAVILIYWPRQVAGREMKLLPGGYDNNSPRDQQANLSGIGRRALAAHLNGLEAFPIFAVAVLAAVQRNADARAVAALCTVFVLVRILFVAAYLRDKGGLRSAMFGVGLLVCLALLGLAIAG